MTQATGSACYLQIVEESVFGTTPATPQMTTLSNAAYGESITANIAQLVSNAITSQRGVTSARGGLINVSGSAPFEASTKGADILFEGLLGGKVTTVDTPSPGINTHVYKRANTVKSYTLEKGFTDVSQYFIVRGMKFGKLSVNVTPGEVVTGSFDVTAKDISVSSTPLDATPTTLTHKIFAGIDGTILENAIGAKCTNLSFTIDNELYSSNIIGSRYIDQIGVGKGQCSGQISILFENITLFNKWLNETQTSIKLTLSDSTSSTSFEFHKVKIFGDGLPKIDTAQGVIITFNWIAEYDSVAGTDVTITTINDVA